MKQRVAHVMGWLGLGLLLGGSATTYGQESQQVCLDCPSEPSRDRKADPALLCGSAVQHQTRLLVAVLDFSGTPAPEAEVVAVGHGKADKAVTNSNGWASLRLDPGVDYMVKISLSGFFDAILDGVRLAPGCTLAKVAILELAPIS